MSATTQGCQEVHVDAVTSDGLAHTDHANDIVIVESAVVSEKITAVSAGSTEQQTDDQLLGVSEDDSENGDASSDTLTKTIVQETHSDDDPDFKPDLPTMFAGQDQTPLAKDGVIECDIAVTDEGKSEKIVPVEEKTESADVEMVSKPSKAEASAVIETPAPPSDDTQFDLKDERIVLDPFRVTMLTKGDFRSSKHVKSGRYFLPEIFPLSLEGRKSMFLSNLITQANFLPCAATYQCCFTETPMIRLHCPNIDDFKLLKILYWNTSFLLVNEGKPVRIKIPTEISVEWLDSRKDNEKDLVDRSKCMDLDSDWAIVTTEPNRILEHTFVFQGSPRQ